MYALRSEEITDTHREYAEKVVRQVMHRFGVPPIYFDEYLGAAYTGLLEAAERYDASSAVPFEKYAYLRVRGAVIDYIRESVGESARATKAARLLRAGDCLTEDFQQIRTRLNPEQIDDALAEALDFAAKGALIFRLNYFDCEEEVTSESEEAQCPEQNVQQREVQRAILEGLDHLPPREQEIIRLYYFEDLSFQQIAERLHVTRSWISRMHSRAIRELRRVLDGILPEEETGGS